MMTMFLTRTAAAARSALAAGTTVRQRTELAISIEIALTATARGATPDPCQRIHMRALPARASYSIRTR